MIHISIDITTYTIVLIKHKHIFLTWSGNNKVLKLEQWISVEVTATLLQFSSLLPVMV